MMPVYKSDVRLRFLGTGTPIGLAGLHQACIMVETDTHRLLLDCGMTALASLGAAKVAPAEIDAVIISHLHGDHFGGLASLLLDATMRERPRPLSVAGPQRRDSVFRSCSRCSDGAPRMSTWRTSSRWSLVPPRSSPAAR
jgi:ribonuclease BN (tRNA processing enzyme)